MEYEEIAKRIIKLFAHLDGGRGVWGMDTEIYETHEEAINDVVKELKNVYEEGHKAGFNSCWNTDR